MQVISLFSGIGGFELAAEWMGWENIVSCEINPFGQRVLKHYWPNAYHHDDVHTLTYTRINDELTKRKGADWRTDDIVLVGGFPCQPYSQAGKRLGKEDERHLWPEMLRIISEVKPTYIVGENVYGLVNWSDGLVFEEVCADLEAQGYEVQPVLLPAASIGAPHKRDRVWFVAYRNGSRLQTQRAEQSAARTTGSGSQRPTPDTDSLRHRRWCQQSITNQSEEWPLDSDQERNWDGIWSETAGCCRPTPDTESQRGKRLTERTKTTFTINGIPCNDGPTADTDSDGQHQCDCEHEVNTSQGRKYAQRDLEQSDDDGLDADTRQRFIKPNWDNFPTVSPIRSRNDGLSDRLDGITFSKWRNESIKAAGNAIVPQVVYQIFKCLEAMK